MSKECSLEKNKEKCTCTYGSCSRKGACCACIEYHRDRDELPACYFPPTVERTYDRSISCFIQYCR